VPDEAGQKPIAASPYATGGGGTRLEHRLGTVLLARLLTAGPVFELNERAPERVAFQQSPEGSRGGSVAGPRTLRWGDRRGGWPAAPKTRAADRRCGK